MAKNSSSKEISSSVSLIAGAVPCGVRSGVAVGSGDGMELRAAMPANYKTKSLLIGRGFFWDRLGQSRAMAKIAKDS